MCIIWQAHGVVVRGEPSEMASNNFACKVAASRYLGILNFAKQVLAEGKCDASAPVLASVKQTSPPLKPRSLSNPSAGGFGQPVQNASKRMEGIASRR